MKQVPEGTLVISAEEQLEQLRQKLIGNQAFTTCRGKLIQPLMGLSDQFIDVSASPSDFLVRWDNYLGKVRIMTKLLAKYRRDGWEVAFEELHRALTDKDHVILGETFPLEKTEPITILMLDPIRTMLMMKWIIEDDWRNLRNYLDWQDKNNKLNPEPWFHSARDQSTWESRISQATEPNALTQGLFQAFPTLEQHARRRRFNGFLSEGPELEEAYRDTVVNSFSETTLDWLEEQSNRRGLAGNWQYKQDALDLYTQQYLYIFKSEQSEVLRHFTREEQMRIGSWQFRAPKILNWESGAATRLGIHPEALHSVWQKRQPALTSKGVSHGLGAIILTDLPSDQGDLSYPTRNTLSSSVVKDPYGVIFS